MIFVNTSLEVAMKRNESRARRVSDSIVKSSWNVSTKYRKVFVVFKNGFVVVDNNRADEDVMRTVTKRLSLF